MSPKEALLSQYIRSVTEEEGAALLERLPQLEQDPDCHVPRKLRRRCLRIIRCGKEETAPLRPVRFKTLLRVALVAVLCAALFTTACLASPHLRIATARFFIEMTDNFGKFTFQVEDDGIHPQFDVKGITPEWLPDNLTLDYTSYLAQVSLEKDYIDKNDETRSLYISAHTGDDISYLSVEEADEYLIQIGEYEAHCYINREDSHSPGTIYLVWPIEEKFAIIEIIGDKISLEELLRVAENLKVN